MSLQFCFRFDDMVATWIAPGFALSGIVTSEPAK